MKTCHLCGNEIDSTLSKCPHCGEAQKTPGPQSSAKLRQIQKINIKIDLPTVNEAIRLAKRKMTQARRKNVGVVKIVHGYGSTGKGGKIRIELREELQKMQKIGIIKEVVPGEHFNKTACKQLVRRYPDLNRDPDISQRNKGITLVEL